MPANRPATLHRHHGSKDVHGVLEGRPMTADVIMDAINHYVPDDQRRDCGKYCAPPSVFIDDFMRNDADAVAHRSWRRMQCATPQRNSSCCSNAALSPARDEILFCRGM
jgi:hypothetical protein